MTNKSGETSNSDTFTADELAAFDAEALEYGRHVRDRIGQPKTPSPAPSVLYKYLSPERADVLTTLEFRFTPPAEFGDIFDSNWLESLDSDINETGSDCYFIQTSQSGFPLQGEEKKLLDFVKRSKRMFPNYTLKSIVHAPLFPNDDAKRAFISAYRACMRPTLAEMVCFCVTESRDNRLLWENYAAGSTGFCVGLRGDAELFYVNNQIRIEQVVYLPDPAISGSLEVSMTKRFVIKNADFAAQREWRSVLHKSLTVRKNIGGHIMYFRQALPNDIVEIILGQNASKRIEDELKVIKPAGVPLMRAKAVPGTHRLTFVQVSTS